MGPRDGRLLPLLRKVTRSSPGWRYREVRCSAGTLEPSEFVQAQNDLRLAAAQAKLARISETRKHAFTTPKAAACRTGSRRRLT